MGDVSRRGPYKTKIKSKPKPNEAGTTKHPSVSEDKELIVEQITDEKGNKTAAQSECEGETLGFSR